VLDVVWLVLSLGGLVLLAAGLLGHLDRAGALVVRLWERVHPPPPRPTTVSVEQLAADLRRLAALLERTYATEQPSKMERLTAASLAYDWVLLSACRTLEIPLEHHMPPLDSISRLETEAALASRGLDW
jgi:hypothetical protein